VPALKATYANTKQVPALTPTQTLTPTPNPDLTQCATLNAMHPAPNRCQHEGTTETLRASARKPRTKTAPRSERPWCFHAASPGQVPAEGTDRETLPKGVRENQSCCIAHCATRNAMQLAPNRCQREGGAETLQASVNETRSKITPGSERPWCFHPASPGQVLAEGRDRETCKGVRENQRCCIAPGVSLPASPSPVPAKGKEPEGLQLQNGPGVSIQLAPVRC
jgi:hypothetical protein